MSTPEVLFAGKQRLGVAILNRPKALNTLNYEMLTALREQYQSWSQDASVSAIIIRATGGKAFCAGGDVKYAVQQIMAGRVDVAQRFFRHEYELNHFLGLMQKPNIAFIDGIIMGGGAGVSLHGTFRIATERTVFAMPECAIGLVPDVGASHFLNKLPGQLGTYLGLTGTRLKGYQTVEAGIATHLVSSQRLEELEEAIAAQAIECASPETIERVLSSFQAESSEHTGATGLLERFQEVDECFGFDDVESILKALDACHSSWAKDASKAMSASSPLSQKLTLRMLREGAGKPLGACLSTEYRIVHHITEGPSDFVEGIRALLIEKDGKPRWRHSSADQVSEEELDRFFTAVPQELELQSPRQHQSKI